MMLHIFKIIMVLPAKYANVAAAHPTIRSTTSIYFLGKICASLPAHKEPIIAPVEITLYTVCTVVILSFGN